MAKPEFPAEFPTTMVTIEGWENWLFCDAIGVEPSYDIVHPGLGFLVCVRSSSVSLVDLLEMAGCRTEDGPMLVGSEIDCFEALRVGVTSEVGHRIESLDRKEGRSLGVFDLLTHRLTLSRHGQTVFAYTGRMVLPRGVR